MNKKFWATAFTLSGTMIGAGILGLPYVFSKSGFLVGLFWLIILGIIIIFTKLCLGEISLRTKGKHHLSGYAEKYLGKWGKRIMFFALIFGIYSALLAYLIGEGQSFSKLFTGTIDYALYFALGFWLFMTILLKEGLKGLKKIETWGILAIITIILLIFIEFFPKIKIANLSNIGSNFFLPFGIVLFALLGFTSIPELRLEIRGDEKLLKKAIIVGVLISFIIYLIFSLSFVGVLGKELNEVATLGFGNLVTLFGIFTMLTSFFVLSFSLKNAFKFDWKCSKKLNFLFVSLIPLILYLFVYFFDLASFVKVLGIGGVISGGITGIIILIMNKKSKKQGNRNPEYKMPINWFLIILLSLIFLAGIIVELFL